MSDEEVIPRVHPLRHISVFIYAPLVLMDSFLLLFTTTRLAMKLNWSFFMIGQVTPVYIGVSFFAGLFWGWMADKRGRRPTLITSGIFSIIGLLGFALATEPWHLLVASAVRGFGGAAGLMIARVLVADLAPRKALGERIAAFSFAPYAAPFIGMAIAGPLYQIYDRLPFIMAAITELLALLLAVFVIPETLVKKVSPTEVTGTEEKKQFGEDARDWFLALTRRGAVLYVFAVSAGSVAGTAVSTIVFPLWGTGLGLESWQISLAYTGGMMIGLLSVIPGGILSDRIGRKWPVLFAGFWGALTWPCYTLVPGMPNPFLGFLLINLVSGVASSGGSAFLAYFFEWIPMRGRGRASVIAEMFQGLVTFVFPLVGWVYDVLRPESAFYLAAIIGIFVYVIVWVAWKEAPLPKEKWKLRKSTIALMIVELIIIVIVIVWLFLLLRTLR